MSSALSARELLALATAFRTGVELKDRNHRFKTYKNCFIGADAVTWLVDQGHASSRAEAVALGQQLAAAGIFNHVKGEHTFEDETYFYQFQEQDIRDEDGAGQIVGHTISLASKCGFLLKQGKGKMTRFNRRWFVLSGAYLFYYKQMYDAHPAGDIPLSGATVALKGDGLGFAVETPTRTFQIVAESEEELWAWTGIIRKVIAKSKRHDKRPATELRGTLKFTIRGLCDGVDAANVTTAVARVDGVSSLQINIETETLTAAVLRDIDVDACMTAIEEAGFFPLLE